MRFQNPPDFSTWRQIARQLLAHGIAPHEIQWRSADHNTDPTHAQTAFDLAETNDLPALTAAEAKAPALRISRFSMELLEGAAMFRVEDRWAFLYKILWRLHRGEREACSAGDPDGNRLNRMAKAAWRDIHHMHAYVRFREFQPPSHEDVAQPLLFLAWYEPQHDILLPAGKHFANRMGRLPWLIATPIGCVASDGEHLEFGPPVEKPANIDDPVEELWLTYYRSTFNPARLNLNAMQSHMPQHYWKNLPEAALIPQLVAEAETGARKLSISATLTPDRT